MRKYLPIFLLVTGILVLLIVGFAFFNLRSQKQTQIKEEEVISKIPIEMRPYATLTPDSAGHELRLAILGIPQGTPTLEYELVYTVASGVIQGVPGSVKLEGKTTLERTLTLGTCSAGVCRYDEGVKDGTFILRLRDEKGGLLDRFETGFHLQSKERELSSTDGKFKLTLAKTPSGFFVTMNTFGLPRSAPGEVVAGPYGVFSSTKGAFSGTVEMAEKGIPYLWDGKDWVRLSDGKTSSLGVFILVRE